GQPEDGAYAGLRLSAALSCPGRRGDRMRRRDLLAASLSLAGGARAAAQTPERLRRIGVLIDGASPHPLPDALRAGMKQRGYAEGTGIAFEVRYADGQPARGAEQAAELVRNGVDAIVAHFTPSVRAA